ncbi:MAG TPA: twin-arginine translocase TatA/TatE family subunit [Anaerolineales bacterium]|nr:twin-arginine translocase TatA/TatE family subunit [Anaerolineales bacterium]
MEIFGIGASELVFILIIAIIVLGPKDMQKAGRTIGRWLNQLIRSDAWRALQRASQEVRRLPTHLMREANLDAEDLRQMDREIRRNIDPRPPSARQPAPSRDKPSVLKTEPAAEPPAAPGDNPSDVKQDE